MRSPMKHRKHAKLPRSENCLDRISQLPDELLGHMLSFLPTRCAVSTSILSTRWRYLFTLINCLSFDDAPCYSGSVRKKLLAARKKRFMKFVYKILKLHQISPIKKFCLVCQATYDKSDLNAWVGNALKKGVQELHYEVSKQEVLPDGLFMCETLVSLKIVLSGFEDYVEIPLSALLPRLEILHLQYIRFFNYASVERLFSNCKLLEELTLFGCGCDSDTGAHVIISSGLLKVLTMKYCTFKEGFFEFDAPNLAHLTYASNTGVKIVPSWKDSCSLVTAELEFDYNADDDSNYDSLVHDRELLKVAACKATVLRLKMMNSVEFLLPVADSKQMPDFHRLSRLHFCFCPQNAWKYVTSLLDESPQLESVFFEYGLDVNFYDPLLPPDDEPLTPFSCHVQKIEILRFTGRKGSLLLLGHLLRNARVLKRLIVHTRQRVSVDEQLRISKDLLMLPRASMDCCIELK